ncbi:MAG: DoxX family protein [Caulobacteraceae bacterium]
METLNAWAPRALGLLRIVAALLFIEHGTMKLFHFPVAMPGEPGPLPPIALIAACLETGGGVLLALGLFTRPVAFILSGEMAVAYFMVHFAQSPWPGINQGGEAILYCWLFFYLVFAGGGAWSLDATLRKRSLAVG